MEVAKIEDPIVAKDIPSFLCDKEKSLGASEGTGLRTLFET
jgi:hypothetical protein